MVFSSLQYVSRMPIKIRRFKIILTQILLYLNISITLAHIHIEKERTITLNINLKPPLLDLYTYTPCIVEYADRNMNSMCYNALLSFYKYLSYLHYVHYLLTFYVYLIILKKFILDVVV